MLIFTFCVTVKIFSKLILILNVHIRNNVFLEGVKKHTKNGQQSKERLQYRENICFEPIKIVSYSVYQLWTIALKKKKKENTIQTIHIHFAVKINDTHSRQIINPLKD